MIGKKEFEVIFWLEYMQMNNPDLLAEKMEINEVEARGMMLALEEEGYIEIERREGKIYGSRLTEKGKKEWSNDEYSKWKEEMGY